MLTDLQHFASESRRLIDAALDRLLPAEKIPPEKVHAAIRWSIFAGGKRFRPTARARGWRNFRRSRTRVDLKLLARWK